MRKYYMDNAATSFPKPSGVAEAVAGYMTNVGCNVGRGGYPDAYNAAEVLLETRELLCSLFHYENPRNVIFTANITSSLNYIIKGILEPGDHVLISSFEHNAVVRPLVQLAVQGITFDRIPADSGGEPDLLQAEKLIHSNTRMVIMNHASNVTGDIFAIEAVGRFCRDHRLLFVVDAAQTAGVADISMEQTGIDALAFTGHKGLLGPQGTGGFIIRDEIIEQMTPLIAGGTGSYSHLAQMPPAMPDRFEAGTLNLPGIYGMHAALKFLKKVGINRIREHEVRLTRLMEEGISKIPAVQVISKKGPENRTGIISVNCLEADNGAVAYNLESEFGLMVRCGLHCSPYAHRELGTYPQGTIRFSLGWYNTQEEVNYAVNALAASVR